MDITTGEQVGFSVERLNRIRPMLERYIAEQKFAGFVTAIARRGKLVHLEAVGMSHIEAKQPMQVDTLFRIYSMTKPIVTVAMLMLKNASLNRWAWSTPGSMCRQPNSILVGDFI